MEKVLIITGGSKGLGLGIARFYHSKGYHVISISRSIIEREYAFDQYSCDLSKVDAIAPVLSEIFEQLDMENTQELTLINNAGNLGPINTLDKLAPRDISYTIQVNLTAPLIISSVFLKLSAGFNGKRSIYNISSGAAVNPYESWSMYCSSKAGIDMMTRVVAKEQKDQKVTVVSIYPGIVDTDMQEQARSSPKENFKSVQRFIDFYEQGSLTSPEEVAAKIFELQERGELKNGRILDVRNT